MMSSILVPPAQTVGNELKLDTKQGEDLTSRLLFHIKESNSSSEMPEGIQFGVRNPIHTGGNPTAVPTNLTPFLLFGKEKYLVTQAAEGFFDSFHKMERVDSRRSVPEAYRIVEILHSVVIPTLTAVAWYYCLENRIVLRTHKITITTKLRDCGLHGLGGQITIKENFFHRNTYSEVNGTAGEGTNKYQSDRNLTITICGTSFGAVLRQEERILLNNEDEAAQSLTVNQLHLQNMIRNQTLPSHPRKDEVSSSHAGTFLTSISCLFLQLNFCQYQCPC
ncbi:hypothetical protein BLNAU_5484 [Blattamonas nauphoetae]|uniref:Uncharacterized protein n=1 Tax=Blattamonas nauphoetae TaxID=2049346 RepID=A0ABQ9Y6X4_9EUKA|nr:hypothetical protein BLNAU_5484 [Blattamonas nauphoetae]